MELNGTVECCGKVNVNDWQLNKSSLFLRGELENVLYPKQDFFPVSENISLLSCDVPASTVMFQLGHFTKCVEMQLKLLNRHETYNHISSRKQMENTNFFSIRRMVSGFLIYIRIYMNSIQWDYTCLKALNPNIEEELIEFIATIKRFLSRLRNIPDSTFHYAASNLGNKCTQPEFHMYHTHLELRWLLLTLIYSRCNIPWQSSPEIEVEFDNVATLILEDLVYISLKMFERIPLPELRQKTPYSCTCTRELWLMIQMFMDQLSQRSNCKTFWELLHPVLDNIYKRDKVEERKLFWLSPNESNNLPDCKNPELFCLWLIYHLSLLYGYSPNGIYLGSSSSRYKKMNHKDVEDILKTYVNKKGKDGDRDEIDEELKVMIPFLKSLINEWQTSHIQIISLLWDCFHRRLDQPFLIQSSGPWGISIEKKTPEDILGQVKKRIQDNFEENKESSYGMFLRLLGTFVKRIYCKEDLKCWNQIKGRVYSKFSSSKVAEFAEVGLYNFLSLFLTLAVCGDTINVCSVMLNLLPSSCETSAESRKYSLAWKGKLIVLLLYSENQLNYKEIFENYNNVVNAISCKKDETSRNMMANFISVLNTILLSNSKFQQNEHLFIGGWIDRYLVECPFNRIHSVIQMLIEALAKCETFKNSFIHEDSEGVNCMLNALWGHVASRVRQLAFDPTFSSENYEDLSKLAASFTFNALQNPIIAKTHKHSAPSLFQHFAGSIVVKDVRFIRCYLALILSKANAVESLKKESKNFDNIVIQSWIKCSFLRTDSNITELKYVQNYIQKLQEIQDIFQSKEELFSFENHLDPILSFIMAIFRKRESLFNEQEKNNFDTKIRVYFNNIDKWAVEPITEENKDNEDIINIYRRIGTLILCCSRILYVKNQPKNLLRSLINKIALPSDTRHTYLRQTCKKIFSFIIVGLENLNVRSDLSLQGLLRDLFDQYLPILITASGGINYKIADQLLKCFTDTKIYDYCKLIIETLTMNFIVVSLPDNNTHKNCYLVMILLNNLLRSGRIYQSYVIEFVIDITIQNVLGCFFKVHDIHPHRQQTLDFFRNIFANCYFKDDQTLKEKLKTSLSNVILRNVTVNPQMCFDFLNSLSSINLEIVKCLLQRIEVVTKELERNRRPNAAALRYSVTKLQEKIHTRSPTL